MNNRTSLANKFRRLRENKGLTQTEVADYLNITQPAYAKIESGESSSWATHLENICRLYEIKPEELFKEERIIINNVGKGVGYAEVEKNLFGYVDTVNQMSEKLVQQYEARLKEKDELIKILKLKIENK